MAAARTVNSRARPRRPPAGRPRRRRRAGIRWDRVGRVALLAVLGVVMLLYISPVSNWLAQGRSAREHRTEVRRLHRENAALAERARRLRRPDALEREARRLGMVKRDERAYVILGPGSR